MLFGETTAREYEPVEESFKPEFDLDKDVTPITAIPDEVFNGNNEPKVTEITEVFEISEGSSEQEEPAEPEEAEEKTVSEEPAAPAPEVKEEVKEEIKEEPKEEVEEAKEPERAEVIEINIPDNTTAFSFGDEEKKAPAKTPASAPSKKNLNLDPDIDPDEDLSFNNEEPDNTRLIRREFKRREKEEKAALKEAKRKEKLDKKKKVRRTDFKPGTDIDMMPEDDE